MHNHYHKTIMPQVREAIKTFKAEMGTEGLMLSYEATYNQGFDTKRHIEWLDKEYKRLAKSNEPWEARSDIPGLRRDSVKRLNTLRARLKRIERQINGEAPEITDDMIQQAREYRIEDIIPVRNGVARCVSPNHEDRTPSMNCKNNFAYCHVCLWTGDAIDVYMTVNGTDFKQAVKEMC